MNGLFTGTSGPNNARIMIVGEAWGREERQYGKPFVGQSGQELDRMLAESGIQRPEVFCTNLVNDRPPNNDLFHWFVQTKEARKTEVDCIRGLYPGPKVLDGLDRLYKQIDFIQPEIIIALGNYALWALTDRANIANSQAPNYGWKVPTGIMAQRGSMLTTIPVVGRSYRIMPTLHPAFIMRNWPWRSAAVHDLKQRVPLALTNNGWDKPKRTYIAPPSFKDFNAYMGLLLAKLNRGPVRVASDIETSRRCITCIGFCYDPTFAMSVPLMHHNREPYWPFEHHKVVVKWIRRILNHPNIQLVGQNWLYDTQYIHRWWRLVPPLHFDTMLAWHLLFPTSPKALYYIASMTCQWYQFWKDDKKEADDSEDLEQALRYNCDDLFYTLEASIVLEKAIRKMNLWHLMEERIAQHFLAFDMMRRGVRINTKIRGEMQLQCMDASRERCDFLDRIVPKQFLPETTSKTPWYASPSQLQRFFYEHLGLKGIRHRKTGNVTVNEEAMNELKLRYPELTQIFNTILEIRSLGVFQNNFLSAAIDPDERMRCAFNVAGTSTFRWSSSENAFGRGTNLQNIPTGGEM